MAIWQRGSPKHAVKQLNRHWGAVQFLKSMRCVALLKSRQLKLKLMGADYDGMEAIRHLCAPCVQQNSEHLQCALTNMTQGQLETLNSGMTLIGPCPCGNTKQMLCCCVHSCFWLSLAKIFDNMNNNVN